MQLFDRVIEQYIFLISIQPENLKIARILPYQEF